MLQLGVELIQRKGSHRPPQSLPVVPHVSNSSKVLHQSLQIHLELPGSKLPHYSEHGIEQSVSLTGQRAAPHFLDETHDGNYQGLSHRFQLRVGLHCVNVDHLFAKLAVFNQAKQMQHYLNRQNCLGNGQYTLISPL